MKKISLLLVVSLLTYKTNARKFYFSSSTGNDSYTTTQAQNQATPWQTLKKIQYYTTSGRVLFQPGDTLAFKRGDVFANGNNAYVSVFWWNVPNSATDAGLPQYFTAPSGTATAPIVITNYGDAALPLPNWVHPNNVIPSTSDKNVIGFAGVSWIVIDGIQSNQGIKIPTKLITVTRELSLDERVEYYCSQDWVLEHLKDSLRKQTPEQKTSVLSVANIPTNKTIESYE